MYKNVEIDLKPQPVLEELIKDLTNKMLNYKQILAGCNSGSELEIGLKSHKIL